MTVADLISGSLRLLGVIASGENPGAADVADGLASLNSMLASWRLERLMVYAVLPQTFPLAGLQASYAMGPGGDWNTARPTKVDAVTLQYTGAAAGVGTLVLPIELINRDEYNDIRVPGTSSTIPLKCYPDDSYPARNLYFWPVPQVNYSVQVFTWGLVSGFVSATDTVSLPDGYERALRFNLALELAPEYGKEPSQVVAAAAATSKAAIKSNNIEPLYMSCGDAVMSSNGQGGFNVLTGE